MVGNNNGPEQQHWHSHTVNNSLEMTVQYIVSNDVNYWGGGGVVKKIQKEIVYV